MIIAGVLIMHSEFLQISGDVVDCPGVNAPLGVNVVERGCR
jgi:hypothetical protein